MAFEHLQPTTTQTVERVSYGRAVAVLATYFVIIALFWFYQDPIYTWWKGVRDRHAHASVVELPPILIAEPATSPNPVAMTPAPIYIATPVPTSTTPAVTGSPIPNAALPHTGPATDVMVILFGLAGTAAVTGSLRASAQAKLSRAARGPHIA